MLLNENLNSGSKVLNLKIFYKIKIAQFIDFLQDQNCSIYRFFTRSLTFDLINVFFSVFLMQVHQILQDNLLGGNK